MIRAIIFDLGGVCFDINWIKVNKEMINRFNIPILIRTYKNKKVIKYYKEAFTGKRDFKDTFKELGADDNKIDMVIEEYKKIYKRNKVRNINILKL